MGVLPTTVVKVNQPTCWICGAASLTMLRARTVPFDRDTLCLALERAGLSPVAIARPTWYLPMDYLAIRVASYLSVGNKIAMPKLFSRIKIPINLHDSLLVVFRRTDAQGN